MTDKKSTKDTKDTEDQAEVLTGGDGAVRPPSIISATTLK